MTSPLEAAADSGSRRRPNGRFSVFLFRVSIVILSLMSAACGPEQTIQVEAVSERDPGEVPIAAPAGLAVDGPSIVMITIDTLRRDHMSLYGYDRRTTPRFGALESEMVVFEHAVATSPWTKPSTASLLTGRFPGNHGAQGKNRIRNDVPLLAEVFAAAGYRTAAFSGNPYVSGWHGLDRGFQDFVFLGSDRSRIYRDVTEILAAAESWIDANSDARFFLYLHVMNVHGPYRAPAVYKDRLVDGPTKPFRFRDKLWRDIVGSRREGSRTELTEEHLRDIRGSYDGAVAYTDDTLGDFVEGLRSKNLLDDIVLIVTSDHGEEFFEHGSFGHRHALHAELLDIPLLIRLPGGRGGGLRVDEPVSLIDVAPTVLDLAGLLDTAGERTFGEGRSLVPLTHEDSNPIPPRVLIAELVRRNESGAMAQLWPYRLVRMSAEPAPLLFRIDQGEWKPVDPADESVDVVEQLTAMVEVPRAETRGSAGVEIPEPQDAELRRQLEALGYLEEEE